jgi:hypothetical protein
MKQISQNDLLSKFYTQQPKLPKDQWPYRSIAAKNNSPALRDRWPWPEKENTGDEASGHGSRLPITGVRS